MGQWMQVLEMLMLLLESNVTNVMSVESIVSDEQLCLAVPVSHSHTEPNQLPALDTLQIYVRHGQFGQLLSHLNIVQTRPALVTIIFMFGKIFYVN